MTAGCRKHIRKSRSFSCWMWISLKRSMTGTDMQPEMRRCGRSDRHSYVYSGKMTFVGRIGGDEFVVLMKEVNSIRDAELKAEALCVLFRSLHPEGCPDEVHLSCSIGLAEVPEHGGCSYMELYQKADRALYEAKHRGRNRWVRHRMEDTEEKKEREAF